MLIIRTNAFFYISILPYLKQPFERFQEGLIIIKGASAAIPQVKYATATGSLALLNLMSARDYSR